MSAFKTTGPAIHSFTPNGATSWSAVSPHSRSFFRARTRAFLLSFDQGLGGLFVVRIAGNTITRAGRESIDYAVTHLGTNLIMVLGHHECGAVKGAIGECSRKADTVLPEIFGNIRRAVGLARKQTADKLESRAIDPNVIEQVKTLEQSPLFKKRVVAGRLEVVGARYNLQSGKVEILDAGN